MSHSYTVYRYGERRTLGAFLGVSPMDAARKGAAVERDLPLTIMPRMVAFRGHDPILYAADDNPVALYYVEPFEAQAPAHNEAQA